MEHIIDAQNKAIGRIASEAAVVLRGKNDPNFERHVAPKTKVKIINAGKMLISDKKKNDMYFRHYTGFPGGFRRESLDKVLTNKGGREVLRLAIHGMIPGNKLRPIIMKNLTITE